jgi:PmbA protein
VSDLLELAEKILSRADGGEQLEVFVSSGTDTEIRAYKGNVENLATASSSGVGIRVLRDGPGGARVGAAWSGSLDDDAVAEVLREARANLQFTTEDEFVALATPDGVRAAQLHLVDVGVETTPIDDKIAMAIALEKMVRSSDSRIRQVDAADYSDYVSRGAIVSSSGVSAVYERTGAYLTVEAIAADDDGDYTGYGMSAARGPGGLSVEEAGRDAIEMATHMLGAKKPSSMKGVAVFDPRTAGTLLAIIGSGLSGEAVVKGRSFFADRVGEDVAAASFTLVDDPTDARHFSAAPFDGEGLACRRNVLIENGRLLGFVFDTVSARRAGTTSTGSAARGGVGGAPVASCRALQLTPGPRDQAAILRDVGTGVFVESLTGVHSGVNPISGDFSVGVTGRMIRDGQFAEPIKEATVASTLQRMLLDVIHIGSDQEWRPGVAAAQTVAVDGVSMSGS